VTEYYEILAVKRDCEEADVKKAYRKVSRRVMRKYDVRLTSVDYVAGACVTPRQKWCAGR
jgi:hypothetical protein